MQKLRLQTRLQKNELVVLRRRVAELADIVQDFNQRFWQMDRLIKTQRRVLQYGAQLNAPTGVHYSGFKEIPREQGTQTDPDPK